MTKATDIPVVGAREPCPCGSDKRYKACHGKKARATGRTFVARTFEGLPVECDWVALREIVSAATAQTSLTSGQHITLATLLPGAARAMVRGDGQVMVGLQNATTTNDVSSDLASALDAALTSEPGELVTQAPSPTSKESPKRLQDLIDSKATFDVTVHNDFDYWLDSEADADIRTAADAAREAAVPTARLESAVAAYWCAMGDRDQVRWVLPYDEEPLLNGLARLHVRGDDDLGDGTRLLGTFRAHGLLVPVWDLVAGTTAEQAEQPVAAMAKRLEEAVAAPGPLTAEERRARAGLANRQVTIR